MGGSKRKRSAPPKRSPPVNRRPLKKARRGSTLKKKISDIVNSNIETKQSVSSSTDGVEIFHNNFVTLSNNPLFTSQGTFDPETTQTLNRVGDKITVKGLSIRLMLELNERNSDVSFRLMMVKSARGDTPTRATMFKGQSGNKMLDQFNNERYTIMVDKWVKLTARGIGTTSLVNAEGIAGTTTNAVISRATKIVKLWIPGNKFAKNGVIQYTNGGGQQKFFDYTFMVYAYSNYSCLQDVYYVGRVNDSVFQLYYKDA